MGNPVDFRELACEVLDLCECVFGEDVTYEPIRGGSYEIRGIFDNQFEQVDPDTEVVIASNAPTLGVKLADLPGPPVKGDIVIIREKRFRVIDSQEDGVVGSTLLLHEVC